MTDTATKGREYTGPVRRMIPGDTLLRLSRDWSQ